MKLLKPTVLQWLNNHKSFLCGILLVSTLYFPVATLLSNFTTVAQPIHNLYLTTADDTAGWEIYVLENGEKRYLSFDEGLYDFGPLSYDKQTYYISRTMTEEVNAPLLYLDLTVYQGAVFLEDQVLYSDQPENTLTLETSIFEPISFEQYPGMRSVYVTLPEDYQGKTLTIALSEMISDTALYITPLIVELSNFKGFTSTILPIAIEQTFAATFIFAIGIAILLLFLLRLYYQKQSYSLLLISLSAFLWSSTILFDQHFASYFIPQFSYTWAMFFQDSYFIPLLLFLWIKMTKGKWFFSLPLLLYAGLTIYNHLNNIYFYHHANWLFDAQNWSSFLLYGVLFLLIFYESKLGNTFYQRMLKLLGILVGFFFSCTLISLFYHLSWVEHLWYQFVFGIKDWFFYPMQSLIERTLALIILFSIIKDTLHIVINHYTEHQGLALRQRLTEQSMEHLKHHIDQSAEQRHEVRRHLSTFNYYLKEKDLASAQSYLQQLIDQDDAIVAIIHVEHPLMNQLLNAKLSEATQQGIEVEIGPLAIPPQLSIADYDLSSLMLNILDNAIEACKAIPSTQSKKITLQCTAKHQFLTFTCENTKANPLIPKEASCLYHSSKDDTRGYGLAIIQRIVDHYDGILDIEGKNSTFSIRIALPIIPQDN